MEEYQKMSVTFIILMAVFAALSYPFIALIDYRRKRKLALMPLEKSLWYNYAMSVKNPPMGGDTH